MAPAVRVLITDDRARSRDGLKALLGSCCDAEIVGMAGDGRTAVQMVERHKPDVVVMDVRMPVMDGLAATRVIKERWPDVRVVLLTLYSAHCDEAVACGADAFLIKGCEMEQLLEAILGHEEGDG